MKTPGTTRWVSMAAKWALGLACALQVPTALSQVESRSLVIAEDAGRYTETTRHDPAPNAKQYWTDLGSGTLRRSAIDGASVEEIAAELNTPYGIAFDSALQRILWSSAGNEIVQKLDLAGGQTTDLITSFEAPFAIDVSSEIEQAYYSVSENVIYRHSVDRETGEQNSYALLIVVDSEPIHGLALDVENAVLYIGDHHGRMNRRLDLRSNESQPLIFENLEPALPSGPGEALIR